MPGLPVNNPSAGPEGKATHAPEKPKSALNALATLYGSSSESEDENDQDSAVDVAVPEILKSQMLTKKEHANDEDGCTELGTVVTSAPDGEMDPLQDETIDARPNSEILPSDAIPEGDAESELSEQNNDGAKGVSTVSSAENEIAKVALVANPAPAQAFTEIRSDTNHKSDSGSSDSASDSSSAEDDSDSVSMSDSEDELEKVAKIKNAPRVRGEKRLCDLPPIEDLHITVPHEKCTPIGVVKSFVDPLVIVAGDPGTPALDLDSVLFLEQGDRALGKIFDVFGPVKEPHYCVRFNSKEHIETSGIKCGMKVYCAPDTPHSSFILLAQLRRFRGTDASWKHDIEPPAEVQEFSDDEMEEFAKKGGRRHIRGRGRGATFMGSNGPPAPDSDPSRGRKRQFHPDQPPVPQNPFIPSNVPGFRPRIPFNRGRGRGFARPPMAYGCDQWQRQQFNSFQPQSADYSMQSFNEYWSTYWTNYYYQHPNPNPGPVGSQFYQNSPLTASQFYPRPLPPPPPPPSS